MNHTTARFMYACMCGGGGETPAIQEPASEKVIRGSKEGFVDSIKVNTALIRKRLRTPKLKVKEAKVGTRSNTNVDLVYMEDLVYPSMLEEIEKRIGRYEFEYSVAFLDK